jgi:hypothetical protein
VLSQLPRMALDDPEKLFVVEGQLTGEGTQPGQPGGPPEVLQPL